MDIHRIDLNLLVVLEAIHTEGGLTRAAERLNVTQPAISYSLGRLRELLGDPLFVREGHTMVPTPFTRNIMEPLQHALRSVETMLNDMHRFEPPTAERRFTIGCRDVLESRVLPLLMKRITEMAPRVELATVQFRRDNLKADLFSGRLDAATDVILPKSRHIRHQSLGEDRLVVIARKDHPQLASGMTLEKYLELNHIQVSSRPSGPGVEDFELGRRGMQRRVVLRCQHYFAALRVVSQTDLIVTIPQRLAMLDSLPQGNQILSFPLNMPRNEHYLLWHVNMDNDPANRWLREQIIEAFKETDVALEKKS